MKLLYFWAKWNGRSKNQKELIEKYCQEKDIVLECYDDDNEAMADYDVDHIPTLLVLNDYEVPIGRFVGKIDLSKVDKIIKD